jgi:hypothetical protein
MAEPMDDGRGFSKLIIRKLDLHMKCRITQHIYQVFSDEYRRREIYIYIYIYI